MLTPETFSTAIERFVELNQISYLDAIQHYCDRHQMDYDTIPRLLTADLKHKLKSEAANLNLLTIKRTQLPVELPLDSAVDAN